MSDQKLPQAAPVVAKYDDRKVPIFKGVMRYFAASLAAVARVSEAGSVKYSWSEYGKGWAQVPDGEVRYTEALLRHLSDEAKGEFYDMDTQTLHAANAAWNALARLELILQRRPAITPDFFHNIERLREKYADERKAAIGALGQGAHPGDTMLPPQFRREPAPGEITRDAIDRHGIFPRFGPPSNGYETGRRLVRD